MDAPRLDQVIERADTSACVQGFLEDVPDDYGQSSSTPLECLTNPEIAQMLGYIPEGRQGLPALGRRRGLQAASRGVPLPS
jgi:hypothetical protein